MHNKFTKSLMAGVVASSLMMTPVAGQAGDWMGVVLPIGSLAVTLATAGTVATMTGINTDAAQIAAEALVYAAMCTVTDTWSPEPKDHYEKAAQENDNKKCPGTESFTDVSDVPFFVNSLVAKGLEIVPLPPEPSVLPQTSSRQAAMQVITFLQGSDPNLEFNKDFTSTQERAIVGNQQANEQWISTEGIARAELALMTAQQGAVDDGIGLADTATSLNTEGKADIQTKAVEGSNIQLTLSDMAGSGTSTAEAMRIQSVMNLELAQRMNLTNMLQGNILSLESARLLQESNPN